ncbi:hypothetical protein PYCCODRAFT_1393825 [Trametes coccinea BRFM310]|uniref:Fungal-type protein kinase domain-containing protein n=1 Tax=Trametes coccinea (strain BRFM310) TaxID=1353009 RepID=A0A1Y2IK00_TRAC3|nr:hypothetical protein PYCCODRAFT_1393825 [Trametes coccinea BRFM310]
MSHKLLGLPYDDWIDAFLPIDDSEVDYTKYDRLFDGVVIGEKESEMYEPLITALNDTDILGDFVLAETYARYDKSDSSKKKADGGMYPKGSPAIKQKRTDWATVEVLIECKTNDSGDPYDERTSSGVPFAETRRDALGQIMTYASTVFEYQHLTHHFGVVILGSRARLGRWDRSGIVFSSKFDYKEEPDKLARFFWRVAHATAEARGHDPTATRVLRGSADYKTLKAWKTKKLAEDDYVARRFVRSLNADRPWWRLRVTDRKHGTKEFLVGQPTFAAPGVVGRGTRGYIGLNVSDRHGDNPFVYLKDCWRVEHERTQLEGDILSQLNEKGVTNIPTALYHGDVGDHRTISQDFCQCAKAGCVSEVVEESEEEVVEGEAEEEISDEERDEEVDDTDDESENGGVDGTADESGDEMSDATVDEAFGEEEAETDSNTTTTDESQTLATSRCRMKAHRHYRLVVKEVGLPLQEFPCGRILLWVVRDAIIAHEDAYKKAKIIHRDISVGNILMIPPNGKNGKTTYQGLLADWELSKRLDDYQAEARHPDRTGTWQFMSVHIQDHPHAQVEIADELESFLHVIIYCAIRYLPHTCDDVGSFMYNYFDDGVRRRQPEAEYTCGILKGYVMDKGTIVTSERVPVTFLRSPPIADSKKSSRNSKKRPRPPPPQPHPINRVLSKLFPMFSARYRTTQVQSADPLDAFDKGCPSTDTLRPSQQQEQGESSESLKTHSRMLEVLYMASEEAASLWPGPEDRMPDQLKPNFNPNKPEKTREKPTTSARVGDAEGEPSSKRRRGDASQT